MKNYTTASNKASNHNKENDESIQYDKFSEGNHTLSLPSFSSKRNKDNDIDVQNHKLSEKIEQLKEKEKLEKDVEARIQVKQNAEARATAAA